MIAPASISPPLDFALRPSSALARPTISRTILKLFTFYARAFMRKHFCAIYIVGEPSWLSTHPGPVVIYLNHPSWWDPLICLLLRERFTAHLDNFAPIDSQSLARFRFFRKLGFFGVNQNSTRGTRDFRHVSAEILSHGSSVLWLTPQGEFVDPRVRPTRLKRGIAYLSALPTEIVFLPLALDYFFTGDRLPSAAAHFGEPITKLSGMTMDERTRELASALERTQNALAEQITSKSILETPKLLTGKIGTGGIYGFWQNMRRAA